MIRMIKCNGNKTSGAESNLIWSVIIIGVMSDKQTWMSMEHESNLFSFSNDYKQNWMTRSPIINLL